MNEKITELLKTATDNILGVPVVDQKKFAELIVLECIEVMSKKAKEARNQFTYMGDDVPTTVHQIAIKEHFGVEE